MDVLSIWDLFLTPIYMAIFWGIGYAVKNALITQKPEYQYFVWGLTAKMFGVIAFALIYALYYNGGDTINYFKGSVALVKLFNQNFSVAWSILLNDLSWENFSAFNSSTGWPPWYMWKDSNTFSVSRFSVLFCFLGMRSFIVTSLFTSCISYLGVWKLYTLFVKLYPNIKKELAWCILFIPTLVFWGSGIMKDSYTLGATCWVTYNFYQVFINRKNVLINVLLMSFNIMMILNTKPYVLLSLAPGMILWLNSAYLKQISNVALRYMLLPFIAITVGLGGYFAFTNLKSLMGSYGDVDEAIEKAQIIQQDLLREEQYGSNSYNIGKIDGSIGGLARLAPISIFTALYRPSIVDIGSPIMIISVLENTILLLLTFYLIFKTSPIKMMRIIMREPLLLHSLVFSLLFAFGVGLASANFGALVRYKTPLMPFFFSMLIVVYSINKGEGKTK